MVGGCWHRRLTLCRFRESNGVSVCFPRDTWVGAKPRGSALRTAGRAKGKPPSFLSGVNAGTRSPDEQPLIWPHHRSG